MESAPMSASRKTAEQVVRDVLAHARARRLPGMPARFCGADIDRAARAAGLRGASCCRCLRELAASGAVDVRCVDPSASLYVVVDGAVKSR
jgi:hypothetical protein